MQTFYINKNSTNPILRMELIDDGRYDYRKFYNAIQNSIITFSMENCDTGILKISNAEAELLLREDNSCDEKYDIVYKWKSRDTKVPGKYKGWFNIKFNGTLTENNVTYPDGNLIVPIQEELIIYIK